MKVLDQVAVHLAVVQLKQKLQRRREILRDMIERQVVFETRTMPSLVEAEEHVLRMKTVTNVLRKNAVRMECPRP